MYMIGEIVARLEMILHKKAFFPSDRDHGECILEPSRWPQNPQKCHARKPTARGRDSK